VITRVTHGSDMTGPRNKAALRCLTELGSLDWSIHIGDFLVFFCLMFWGSRCLALRKGIDLGRETCPGPKVLLLGGFSSKVLPTKSTMSYFFVRFLHGNVRVRKYNMFKFFVCQLTFSILNVSQLS